MSLVRAANSDADNLERADRREEIDGAVEIAGKVEEEETDGREAFVAAESEETAAGVPEAPVIEVSFWTAEGVEAGP